MEDKLAWELPPDSAKTPHFSLKRPPLQVFCGCARVRLRKI